MKNITTDQLDAQVLSDLLVVARYDSSSLVRRGVEVQDFPHQLGEGWYVANDISGARIRASLKRLESAGLADYRRSRGAHVWYATTPEADRLRKLARVRVEEEVQDRKDGQEALVAKLAELGIRSTKTSSGVHVQGDAMQRLVELLGS